LALGWVAEDPLKSLPSPKMGYHAKFGRSTSKSMSICKGIQN